MSDVKGGKFKFFVYSKEKIRGVHSVTAYVSKPKNLPSRYVIVPLKSVEKLSAEPWQKRYNSDTSTRNPGYTARSIPKVPTKKSSRRSSDSSMYGNASSGKNSFFNGGW